MAHIEYSIDELIGIINKSGLNTVITEGYDDYIAYKKVERFVDVYGVSFMPVGGKRKVIELYNRKNELTPSKILFIMDMDTWVHTGTPAEFVSDDIVLTKGYSIENDLIEDGEVVQRLMNDNEREKFYNEIDSILSWYVHNVEKHINSDFSCELKSHPNRILSLIESGQTFTYNNKSIFNQVKSDPIIYMRGKTVLALIARQLSSSTRPVKYSKDAIIDICSNFGVSNLKRVAETVKEHFAPTQIGSEAA
ncbi:DUF4435 domain-containing protein [uncultured Brevundimonas sp.]|uniref:DUF4435 domain-containing protein n=1 Tax=uncultured Brevundimonas sp. TaxID=213418 RepID=UPI002629E66D|nr:DUF4435 domain-containing protein [uncultured Brevundimonas sp.]